MSAPDDVIWEIEPHTQAKHEILRRYLGAWFPILGSGSSRIVYIDGFAGPGRYTGGEPGSPLIALSTAAAQAKHIKGEAVFWFIEQRKDRAAQLESELAVMNLPSNFRVHVEIGEFDDRLGTALDDIEARGAHFAPTFAFIDPFGFSGIPFDVVRRLLSMPKIEVFITFMSGFMKRFIEVPDSKVRDHFVSLFGTPAVLRIPLQATDRITALRWLYQQQLSAVAKFVRYFEMCNDCNQVIYDLFFATNHRLGHAKMKEAMWRVDPVGTYRFADATNPDQLVLFEADTSSEIKDILVTRFAGRRTIMLRVREWVEDETPYLDTQMKAALRQLEDEGRLVVEPLTREGKRRKKHQFPDSATVTLLH